MAWRDWIQKRIVSSISAQPTNYLPTRLLRRFVLTAATSGLGLAVAMRLLPATAYQSAIPPPTLITGLGVAGIVQTLSSLGETAIALADLAPDQNQLQIDFVGLSFVLEQVDEGKWDLGLYCSPSCTDD